MKTPFMQDTNHSGLQERRLSVTTTATIAVMMRISTEAMEGSIRNSELHADQCLGAIALTRMKPDVSEATLHSIDA